MLETSIPCSVSPLSSRREKLFLIIDINKAIRKSSITGWRISSGLIWRYRLSLLLHPNSNSNDPIAPPWPFEKHTKSDCIVIAICGPPPRNPLNPLIAHDPNDSRARTKIYRRQLHSRVTKLPHPRTIAGRRNCPNVLGVSLSRAWSRNFRLPTASLRVSGCYCPSRGASTRCVCIRPPTVTRPSFSFCKKLSTRDRPSPSREGLLESRGPAGRVSRTRPTHSVHA